MSAQGECPQIKPFSTYPEQHAHLLALANKLQRCNVDVEDVLKAADELSDLVCAILEDEAPTIDSRT